MKLISFFLLEVMNFIIIVGVTLFLVYSRMDLSFLRLGSVDYI